MNVIFKSRLIIGFTLALAATAGADLTTVYNGYGPNGAGGEWNLFNSGVGSFPGDGIMEYLYGAGHFARIDDAFDSLWTGSGAENAGIVGVYAGAGETLYTTDPSALSWSLIFSPAGTIGLPPQRFFSAVPFSPAAQPFLFLDDVPGYTSAFSDPALNGEVDRMVTLAVTGYLAVPGDPASWTVFPDGTTHYVIGFEDYDDFDYQDLVVEVAGVAPVPEPDVALLMVLCGTAMALRAVRSGRCHGQFGSAR